MPWNRVLLIGCVSCALFILNGLTGKITAKALGFALVVLMPITLRWIRMIVVLKRTTMLFVFIIAAVIFMVLVSFHGMH